jgi:hypothetical protein
MLSHGKRWKYAFRAFFSLIVHGRVADDILAALAPQRVAAPAVPAPAPAAPAAPDPGDRAIQILGLLQRDGRLVDFLMEDLTAYPDAQVGAAVRDVHANCRASLSRYVTLAPVIDTEEGGRMTVQAGADPARIKVVGAVAAPPVSGVVRHRGWEAARLDLPPLPSTGRTLIAPAEVELA